MSFLNPLYHGVAILLTGIHSGLSHIFGANSGASWALSIVLLTIGMRLVLFPVFVKQIRNQRAMQAVQPKMKELQTKYKNDKEKLNQEMMALWKEAGANPFSGCLPLLLQIPIFISLYHTLRNIKPLSHCPTGTTVNTPGCYPNSVAGFSQHEIFSAAHAKIFGVPISASFKTTTTVLHALGGSQGSTRALALIMTVLMGASTFITQRQLMARNGPAADTAMAQQQKVLLYVFPLFFLIYGFYFPIGVLLYWLTTNFWSMGQQFFVIRRMEAVPESTVVTPAGPAPGAKPKVPPRGSAAGPAPGAKPNPPSAKSNEPSATPDQPSEKPNEPSARPSSGTGDVVLPPGGAISAPPPRPASPTNPSRPNPNRSKKRNKRGRR